jgi:8-oxo-dGTP pyrophosphatase MutT (NUDIX family)
VLNSSLATVDFLRQRFRAGLADEPLGVVREPGVPLGKPLTPAAVLIAIVVRESGLTILLTQRTAHLRDHAGQVSFPGGRCEPEDSSPVATALREAQEEVGVAPAQVEVIGQLPDYSTGTGFLVTPVVGLVTPPLNLKLDDFEVAEVFEPPFDFLLDVANHQRHQIEVRGALHEYWAMPWRGYYIWGATAGMLVSLQRFLAATP